MKTIYLILCTITLSQAFYSCHEAKSTPKNANAEIIPVKVINLEIGFAQQTIQASGQFTTEDETMLSFKSGGIINKIFVKEGDMVRAGQLLATIHLTEIDAQVQQTNIGYEKAKRDFERYDNLYKDSVVTLEQAQNAKTALEVSKQQLNAARFNKNYAEIRSTANGYVLKRFAGPGQLVGPGMPVFQVNGALQSAWVLKANVSDVEWATIKVGDVAKIETDAHPGQFIDAFVLRKAEGVDPVTGTFSISLSVKGKASVSIASGLFGKVQIFPSEKVSSWSVPYDAIMDGDAGEAYVYITNDNKTATKVKIRLGNLDNGKVAVISGLESAKALIVSGSAYLKDGSPITISQ